MRCIFNHQNNLHITFLTLHLLVEYNGYTKHSNCGEICTARYDTKSNVNVAEKLKRLHYLYLLGDDDKVSTKKNTLTAST